MWSGPRNISTALLRSWGNRPDTFVTDEPLYAHYLTRLRPPHPGIDEVIASQETDWRKVVQWLTGPIPQARQIWYQKHMSHHFLPGMELDWVDRMANCFLLREPREMLASLIRVLPNPTLFDTGLAQQKQIFEHTRRRTGQIPPVIDARDVLENPRHVLGRLCAALEIPFTEAMLSWPSGRRDTDGVWAKYWYASVEESTGFQPYHPKSAEVPANLESVLAEAEALYRELHRHRLA